MRRFALCLALVVFAGCAEVALAQKDKHPTISPRQAGVPTLWVAAEAILGPNIDLAISIDKNWVVVGVKLQVAEGDETYGDPKQTPWIDCNTGNGTCDAQVPVKFDRFWRIDSRDGSYTTWQTQAMHGSPVRFRARYALEIQPKSAN